MAPRFGSKKQGPDLSWADEGLEDPNDRSLRAVSPPSNVPGPTFPPRYNIRTPKPLSDSERRAVEAQLLFRRQCHESPLYTVLDRNSLIVDGEKIKKDERERRGFDVFGGQERWSTRKLGRVRKEPDLSKNGRGDYGYSLTMFPQELWGVLDPEQTNPEWKKLPKDAIAFTSLDKSTYGKKRKKNKLDFDRFGQDEDVSAAKEEIDSDDEDPIRGAGNRKRARQEDRRAGGDIVVGEKQGLEAEDEYEREANPEDDDEDGGEDEPVDSDFSEDEDAMNDYNAENYFDDGEDDAGDDGDGGGDDY